MKKMLMGLLLAAAVITGASAEEKPKSRLNIPLINEPIVGSYVEVCSYSVLGFCIMWTKVPVDNKYNKADEYVKVVP